MTDLNISHSHKVRANETGQGCPVSSALLMAPIKKPGLSNGSCPGFSLIAKSKVLIANNNRR